MSLASVSLNTKTDAEPELVQTTSLAIWKYFYLCRYESAAGTDPRVLRSFTNRKYFSDCASSIQEIGPLPNGNLVSNRRKNLSFRRWRPKKIIWHPKALSYINTDVRHGFYFFETSVQRRLWGVPHFLADKHSVPARNTSNFCNFYRKTPPPETGDGVGYAYLCGSQSPRALSSSWRAA
jgi:hypothetical protein